MGETQEAGSFGETGCVSYKGSFCHQLTSSSALGRMLRCVILLQTHATNSLQESWRSHLPAAFSPARNTNRMV